MLRQHLGHLVEVEREGGAERAHGLERGDAGEDAVGEADDGALRRHVAAEVREVDDEAHLLQVHALPRRIWALRNEELLVRCVMNSLPPSRRTRYEGDILGFRDVGVVGYEGVDDELLQRVAAVLDHHNVLLHNRGSHELHLVRYRSCGEGDTAAYIHSGYQGEREYKQLSDSTQRNDRVQLRHGGRHLLQLALVVQHLLLQPEHQRLLLVLDQRVAVPQRVVQRIHHIMLVVVDAVLLENELEFVPAGGGPVRRCGWVEYRFVAGIQFIGDGSRAERLQELHVGLGDGDEVADLVHVLHGDVRQQRRHLQHGVGGRSEVRLQVASYLPATMRE